MFGPAKDWGNYAVDDFFTMLGYVRDSFVENGGGQAMGGAGIWWMRARRLKVEKKGFESFEAFKREYGAAGEGKVWHHIVEQRQANIDRFGAKAIHNTSNLVPISREANQALVDFYLSKQPFSKGMRVREYLNSKSFDYQDAFGRDMLNRVLAGKSLP